MNYEHTVISVIKYFNNNTFYLNTNEDSVDTLLKELVNDFARRTKNDDSILHELNIDGMPREE